MAHAKPTFPPPLPPPEGGVEVAAGAEELAAAEELAGAGALEVDCGASEVVGTATDVGAAELLRLVVGRGLQRLVELSVRLFLLAITS